MAAFMPINQAMLEAALGQFSKVSVVVTGLLGFIVVLRMTFLLLSLAAAEAYAEVLRDALIYLLAVSLFPSLVKVAVEITGSLAFAIDFSAPMREPNLVDRYLQALQPQLGIFGIAVELGGLGILHIARAIYSLLLSVLVAIGPVVVFMSVQITRSGLRSYITALLSLLLWPLCWNLMGALATEISRDLTATSLGSYCFWMVVSMLQILSPIFSVYLFHSLAAGEAFRRPIATLTAIRSAGVATMRPRMHDLKRRRR